MNQKNLLNFSNAEPSPPENGGMTLCLSATLPEDSENDRQLILEMSSELYQSHYCQDLGIWSGQLDE